MRDDLVDYELLTKMSDYMVKNRIDMLMKKSLDCPYTFDDPHTESVTSMIWATFAATLSDGKTRMVDDYAKKHVDDPVFVAKIRRATSVLCGRFRVLECKENRRFVIESEDDGTIYDAVSGPDAANVLPHVHGVINCTIHPWNEDGSYNIAMVFGGPPPKYRNQKR